MENLFGTVFGFIPIFWGVGRFSLLHPDRIASGNGKWPPPPEPLTTPPNWAWSIGWAGQVGGGFLWTTSFTYRKREKTKDKAI